MPLFESQNQLGLYKEKAVSEGNKSHVHLMCLEDWLSKLVALAVSHHQASSSSSKITFEVCASTRKWLLLIVSGLSS